MLRKEGVQTQQVNEVLFKDKQLLGGNTPVFDQLSPVGQMVLAAAAENSMDALLGALSGSSTDELGETLGAALATVSEANDAVKGHIRHFLLESNAFNRLDVLANISQLQGGAAAGLGLVEDARLRAENIMSRVRTMLLSARWRCIRSIPADFFASPISSNPTDPAASSRAANRVTHAAAMKICRRSLERSTPRPTTTS